MPKGIYPHKSGWKQSKEAIRKIRKNHVGMTGKHHSIKTKIKQSEAQKGEKNHNFGKHCNEETKRKIGEARKGIKRPPFSQKWRKNISEGQKGEKNHHYKDGRTPKNHRIRKSFEMNEWRKKVFERDNFACRLCRKKGVYLNAHHLKPFAKYPKLRFKVSNGVTLCQKCHKAVHNKSISMSVRKKGW
jgi:5-methylcytosine-specific restriction endonuclease McrA